MFEKLILTPSYLVYFEILAHFYLVYLRDTRTLLSCILEIIMNFIILTPITDTAWVRARLCKIQKGCTRWFSPGTPALSTTKTCRHDIAEILLKVALNTINQIKSNIIPTSYLEIIVYASINGIAVADIACVDGIANSC